MYGAIVPIGFTTAALAGLWLYCVVDAFSTDAHHVRSLPKNTWLFVVFFAPLIGSAVWLAAGRPIRVGSGTSVRNSYMSLYQPSFRLALVGVEDTAVWKPNTNPSFPVGRFPDSATWERRLSRWEAEFRNPGNGDS